MRNYSSFNRGGQKSGGTFHRSRQIGPRPKKQSHTGAYINPQKFINKATAPKERQVFVPKHSFADFGFSPTLERNVARRGYEKPTPIQDEAIPHILEGKDLIGLARTGTGKTAAFALPIIHKLRSAEMQKTVLVMAPTRELAGQIDEDFRAFSEHLKVRTALCVGGVSIQRQRSALAQHPQIIIGTPGRLVDLLNQRVLRLERATTLVLDEVDRMLDMGFIRDIRLLIAALPKERQSLCFSATINPDIQKLLDQMLRSPITVSVRESETENHITQDVIVANSKEQKIEILKELLRKTHFVKVLIFGKTKWGVQKLAQELTKNGIQAEAIHGNKSQPQRQRALKAFKENKVRVLVATDVAARGLDIPNVSHVINFDQPNSYEDYIHRIGRTGRAGKQGDALTFVPSR